jgi:hypothetical protein
LIFPLISVKWLIPNGLVADEDRTVENFTVDTGGENPHGCETPMGYMSQRPSHRSSFLYLAWVQVK